MIKAIFGVLVSVGCLFHCVFESTRQSEIKRDLEMIRGRIDFLEWQCEHNQGRFEIELRRLTHRVVEGDYRSAEFLALRMSEQERRDL